MTKSTIRETRLKLKSYMRKMIHLMQMKNKERLKNKITIPLSLDQSLSLPNVPVPNVSNQLTSVTLNQSSMDQSQELSDNDIPSKSTEQKEELSKESKSMDQDQEPLNKISIPSCSTDQEQELTKENSIPSKSVDQEVELLHGSPISSKFVDSKEQSPKKISIPSSSAEQLQESSKGIYLSSKPADQEQELLDKMLIPSLSTDQKQVLSISRGTSISPKSPEQKNELPEEISILPNPAKRKRSLDIQTFPVDEEQLTNETYLSSSLTDQKQPSPNISIQSSSNEQNLHLETKTVSPSLSPKQQVPAKDIESVHDLDLAPNPNLGIHHQHRRKNLTQMRKSKIEKFRKAYDENPKKYGIPGGEEFMKYFLNYIGEPEITEDTLTDWLERNPRLRGSFSVHIPPGEKGLGVFSMETGLPEIVKRSLRSRFNEEEQDSLPKSYALRSGASKFRKIEPMPESDLEIEIEHFNNIIKTKTKDKKANVEQALHPAHPDEPDPRDVNVEVLNLEDAFDEGICGSDEIIQVDVNDDVSSENLRYLENQSSNTKRLCPSIAGEEIVAKNISLKPENSVSGNVDDIPVTPAVQPETHSHHNMYNTGSATATSMESRPHWYVAYLINELRNYFNARFEYYGHLVPLVNYLEIIYTSYPPVPYQPSYQSHTHSPVSNNQSQFSTNQFK